MALQHLDLVWSSYMSNKAAVRVQELHFVCDPLSSFQRRSCASAGDLWSPWCPMGNSNCGLRGFFTSLQVWCLFVFLLSLHPMPSLLYISYAAAAAIMPPGTHHIIGLSSSRPPCFLLQGQPLWCFFPPVTYSWHLPSHFPVNSPCAGKLCWGIPPPLISTASDWLANPLIALLLKQLVLLGDREDTADEVKQLDPVWSCKRRHTPSRDVKGWLRIRQITSVQETEDKGRRQSDKEWDRE